MPVNLQKNLPAIELLKREHIFVMDALRASEQDIRPLKIVVLNLMPIKITTETDFVRLLSNSPLQIELEFMKIKGHVHKNTSVEHIETFYKDFDEFADDYYDGMIITGAPVEQMPFEDVNYWDEVTNIFNWARTHVTSTFYICWAAQAAMYHFYGIPKYDLQQKMFGVFKHSISDKSLPIFRGFDDEFFVPQSRHTEVRQEDIERIKELKLISESKESGVYMAMARGGREFFITGHSEYSPYTLRDEYMRDASKGLDIQLPVNYFKNDNPNEEPIVRWRGHANLLFNNWLNYYIYQETPYNIRDIKNLGILE
jgi:homoserine O-succinyltransferase